MGRKIREMLIQAYMCLGEHDAEKIDKNVEEACSYLEQDRNHYMEVAYGNQKPDLFWYRTYQVEGKVIPIASAQRVVWRSRYVAHIDNIFGLLVSEKDPVYVICRNEFRESRESPEENAWKYTEYYEVELCSVKNLFETKPAKELIPLPGTEGHKVYQALLKVCDYFGGDRERSELLEKAEIGMQIYRNIERPSLEIEGELYEGKWLPIAMKDYPQRLLMLVTESEVEYVIGSVKASYKRVRLEDFDKDWRLYFY